MRQDLVGGLRPGERVAALVPAVDEGPDRADELRDTREGATADGLAGDDPEERLDQVEPGAGGRVTWSSRGELELSLGPGRDSKSLNDGIGSKHDGTIVVITKIWAPASANSPSVRRPDPDGGLGRATGRLDPQRLPLAAGPLVGLKAVARDAPPPPVPAASRTVSEATALA